MSKVELNSIKVKSIFNKKMWPYAHCPKCGEQCGLCQDGFPLLTDWWFYCQLCPYSQFIAPIDTLTPQIKPVDVVGQMVFEQINTISAEYTLSRQF